MSNQILHGNGPKIAYDHTSCFACLDTRKKEIQVMLQVGRKYEKCSLIVKPEDGSEPYLMLSSDIRSEYCNIVGITPCDIDLTDVSEADNVPRTIWTGVGLNANYVCFAPNTTAADVDFLERISKDCVWFIPTRSCDPVPDDLCHLVSDEATASGVVASPSSAKKKAPFQAGS